MKEAWSLALKLHFPRDAREAPMILFLALLLIALWFLGMVTTSTLGGYLHILLIVAIVFLLVRVIRGQPV
jgi:hypothetical protein